MLGGCYRSGKRMNVPDVNHHKKRQDEAHLELNPNQKKKKGVPGQRRGGKRNCLGTRD